MRPAVTVHEAMRTEYDGRSSLFECLMCRFRAALNHADGGYTLLDRGDPDARHHGATAPITLAPGGLE